MLFCDVFRKTVEPLSGSGRLISGEYDNSTKPCAVQAILESLMSQDMSDGTHRHTFPLLNIQHSTFHHQPKAGGPPFLSRTGNVLHSSRESAFACLLFNKVEEVQHIIVIPSDSHSGINYPPFANANGFETTDCLECLQILNILIYGRRVYFKAGDWILCTMIGYRIPERETYCMLHLCVVLGF